MSEAAERVARGLADLERRELRRTRRVIDSPQGAQVRIDGRALRNFSSNDYLGLANDRRLCEAAHHAIAEYGVGTGASALVSGHQRLHQRAEERFAAFTGLPRAMLFGNGYLANLGILTALADREAHIFSDELNHACLIDGARLARSQVSVYPHADVGALAEGLAASRAPVRIVATDAVFSMDGDVAPLPQLLELCERYDAWLVIDDAHGIGVLGARGRGSLEHFGLGSPRIVLMATLGKALGGYGAFVAGDANVIEWMVQRARTYIYSTALPPAEAAVAVRAMELVDEDPSLLARLRSRVAQLQRGLLARGFRGATTGTAIQPIILGSAGVAVDVSALLAQLGFFVPAIRPPTVPDGTSRLRISVSAAHEASDVEALLSALSSHLPA